MTALATMPLRLTLLLNLLLHEGATAAAGEEEEDAILRTLTRGEHAILAAEGRRRQGVSCMVSS
jgi:hypothetical protein